MSGSAKGDPARVEGTRPATTTPAPAAMNASGHSVGTGPAAPAGTETERDAPGAPGEKTGDDTK